MMFIELKLADAGCTALIAVDDIITIADRPDRSVFITLRSTDQSFGVLDTYAEIKLKLQSVGYLPTAPSYPL